jgi:DNA polymerase III delta' subunit
VDGFLTVGHPAAVAAVRAMLGGSVPHAVLIAGPASVGKVALAEDLAAALLCTGATGNARPCRQCRGCRRVEHGNHPDLHRLGPIGAGSQIVIGGPDASARPGVRDLVDDLALLPVEGGARVAIVRDAHRANEHAQSALLKTLEEPPSRTYLILCADDEELLLPTIRSRCARLRLGTVDARAIERLLDGGELADAPTAARLARLSAGRPGVAMAYARSPEAQRLRDELARTFIDLLGDGPGVRLAAAKGIQQRALDLGRRLVPPVVDDAAPAGPMPRGSRPKAAARPVAPIEDSGDDGEGADAEAGAGKPTKVSAPERRAAAGLVIEAWRDVARDIALVERGATRSVHDPGLLEEYEVAARDLERGAAAAFVAQTVRAAELLAGNVTPELILDWLLLRWPARRRATA